MVKMNLKVIKKNIREIPDFPKKGILFRDITPMLKNGPLFKDLISFLAQRYKNMGVESVACVESRGFIFGAALAYELGVGFIPLRKPGKLPYKTIREAFSLEYGKASLEIHTDAVKNGEKVIIIDDLLATGGTIRAAIDLVEKLGGKVMEVVFIIELKALGGRKKLVPHKVFSVVEY